MECAQVLGVLISIFSIVLLCMYVCVCIYLFVYLCMYVCIQSALIIYCMQNVLFILDLCIMHGYVRRVIFDSAQSVCASLLCCI